MIPIIAKIVEKDLFYDDTDKTYFSTEIQVGSLFVGGAGPANKKSREINTIEAALADATECISSLMEYRNPDLSLYSQPEYLVVYKSDRFYKEKVYGSSDSKYRHPKIDKKQIVKFVPVDNKSEIQENDVITLSSLDEKINFPMVKVYSKRNGLGFSSKNMIIFKKSFIYLSELQDYGFKVKEVLRKEVAIDKMKTYVPKASEISLKPVFPAKSGSLASLYDSYNYVASVYEYLESRRHSGDIFLDQWMSDAYKESKESMESIKKLIETLENL